VTEKLTKKVKSFSIITNITTSISISTAASDV